MLLTHSFLETRKRVIGKQCRPSSDATCGADQGLPVKSRKETPQKLTQLSSRSHPRHLVGKKTAQKDITIDTTSDNKVNSNFPNRWSPASLTFNNYIYLFLAHLSLLRVSFWDTVMSVVRRTCGRP